MIRIESGMNSNQMSAIKAIFFASSSRKDFPTAEEREAFFLKWTAFYTEQCPHKILTALDGDNDVLGYLMGCEDSARASLYYSEKNPSYLLFEDQFASFPAHFHVNCHPDARGMGVGSLLVSHFVQSLRLDNVAGLHVVTSPNASNRLFYAKNGFDVQLMRERNGHSFLFMGRKL
jgi:GNAT superfamily N-acetyltransferase